MLDVQQDLSVGSISGTPGHVIMAFSLHVKLIDARNQKKFQYRPDSDKVGILKK